MVNSEMNLSVNQARLTNYTLNLSAEKKHKLV